jgi:hypothetical protein
LVAVDCQEVLSVHAAARHGRQVVDVREHVIEVLLVEALRGRVLVHPGVGELAVQLLEHADHVK